MVDLGTFDSRFQGVVSADGTCDVTFGPPLNNQWVLSQVSTEMPDAPSGSTCVLRKMGAFVTFLIAQGDAAGGDPPLPVRGGETVSVEWEGCTPGDIGRVYVIYEKSTY
jgi:hypothetical protein